MRYTTYWIIVLCLLCFGAAFMIGGHTHAQQAKSGPWNDHGIRPINAISGANDSLATKVAIAHADSVTLGDFRFIQYVQNSGGIADTVILVRHVDGEEVLRITPDAFSIVWKRSTHLSTIGHRPTLRLIGSDSSWQIIAFGEMDSTGSLADVFDDIWQITHEPINDSLVFAARLGTQSGVTLSMSQDGGLRMPGTLRADTAWTTVLAIGTVDIMDTTGNVLRDSMALTQKRATFTDSFAVHSTLADVSTEDSLIAYYNGSNWLDYSGNGNDGTTSGTVTTVAYTDSSRYGGSAQSFIADGYVEADGIATDLAGTHEGHIGFDYYTYESTPSSAFGLVVLGDGNADEYLQVDQKGTDGVIRILAKDAGTTQFVVEDNNAATANQWNRWDFVQDGTSITVYKNGTVYTDTTVSTATDMTSWMYELTGIDSVRIGCRNFNSGGNTAFAHAIMDNIIIQKRAPSAVEIRTLYEHGRAYHQNRTAVKQVYSSNDTLWYNEVPLQVGTSKQTWYWPGITKSTRFIYSIKRGGAQEIAGGDSVNVYYDVVPDSLRFMFSGTKVTADTACALRIEVY